jgi:hypothetical protein
LSFLFFFFFFPSEVGQKLGLLWLGDIKSWLMGLGVSKKRLMGGDLFYCLVGVTVGKSEGWDGMGWDGTSVWVGVRNQ